MQAQFKLMAHSANARSGKLLINNKELTTPAVVFTGVNTTMLTNQELQSLGTVAIKQSALRYWLNGSDVFGDLHDRLNWAGWIIGDPGCEQAYRWAKPRGRKKDGVSFHEPESGQQKLYKPEDARGWQDKLGCDLQTGFWRWEDYYSPVDDLQASAKHTASWTTEKGDNTLLPIVGGGLKRVRQASAETAIKQSPLGYAIAGVDTEVKLAEQVRLVKEVVGMLPEDGLRYLPTSGSIEHVLMAMINGVDLVDSDCADEAAQHGVAFDGTKRIHLAKEHFLEDSAILVDGCQCPTCRSGYSRSYLHQLQSDHSPLANRLLASHNLYVLNRLVADLQDAIAGNRVDEFVKQHALG